MLFSVARADLDVDSKRELEPLPLHTVTLTWPVELSLERIATVYDNQYVAQALKAKLLSGEHASEQSERPPSGNLEAYNALLEGRFYWNRGTRADMRKAIDFLVQATQLDPRYALACSTLAPAWSDVGEVYLEGAPAQEAYAKAREAADRALTISPDLAGAHSALGYLLENADFDWHGAEAEYRRAQALAPNDSWTKSSLGSLLAALGELDRALELMRDALAIEPLRRAGYDRLARSLPDRGRTLHSPSHSRSARTGARPMRHSRR